MKSLRLAVQRPRKNAHETADGYVVVCRRYSRYSLRDRHWITSTFGRKFGASTSMRSQFKILRISHKIIDADIRDNIDGVVGPERGYQDFMIFIDGDVSQSINALLEAKQSQNSHNSTASPERVHIEQTHCNKVGQRRTESATGVFSSLKCSQPCRRP